MGRSWSMGTPLHLPQDRQRERELRAGWSRVHRRGAAGAAGPSRDGTTGRQEVAEAYADSAEAALPC